MEDALKQKAKKYVEEKSDKGNFDVELFGKAYFSESSMEHSLVDFANKVTLDLQKQIDDLTSQVKDIRHQEVVDMYSRYPC